MMSLLSPRGYSLDIYFDSINSTYTFKGEYDSCKCPHSQLTTTGKKLIYDEFGFELCEVDNIIHHINMWNHSDDVTWKISSK